MIVILQNVPFQIHHIISNDCQFSTFLCFFCTDLHQIYYSEHLDPELNVRSLQNKVQWDIQFYVACRGGEGVQQMTKKTFALKRDPDTNLCYIVKVVDEETKNHKETDKDIITGFMPEIPNCKMCPVQSFLTYLYSLSPECENLWQVPKFTNFPTNP